jgi:hypothetical protein
MSPPASGAHSPNAPPGPAPAGAETGAPDSRFGAVIELPWWAPLAMVAPLLTLLGGLILGAPVEARVTDVVVSALMVYVILKVSTTVRSRNLQSVYISAAYAFWFFLVLIWLVSAVPLHLLR